MQSVELRFFEKRKGNTHATRTCPGARYTTSCSNRYDTDSPLCVRRMASASVGETSIVLILGHSVCVKQAARKGQVRYSHNKTYVHGAQVSDRTGRPPHSNPGRSARVSYRTRDALSRNAGTRSAVPSHPALAVQTHARIRSATPSPPHACGADACPNSVCCPFPSRACGAD